MGNNHTDRQEFEPNAQDYEALRAEMLEAAQPASLEDVIDLLVDRLPATPEPERPSWLLPSARVVKAQYETSTDSNGNVEFGEAYTQRKVSIEGIDLTIARHEEHPHRSQLVFRVPATDQLSAYNVWYRSSTDGSVRRNLGSSGLMEDMLPHANRKLETDQARELISTLFLVGIETSSVVELVKPTERDYELLAETQAQIDEVHRNLRAAYKADEENRRQAIIDSEGIILRGA